MSRRGLTLLEVLIALTLLVALGAIAFPAVMGTLGQRAFETAGDQLVNQLLLARATAQETGRPVEVIYRPATGRVVARYFDLDAASLDAPVRFDDEPSAPWQAPELAELDDDAEAVIMEGWASRALPEGTRLTDQAPADAEEQDLLGPAPIDLAAAGAPEPAPLRLAIFLADGSALLAIEAWLVDGEGRFARLAVSPWTGLPSLSEAAAPAEAGDSPSDDEAGEQDELDEEPWPQEPDTVSGSGDEDQDQDQDQDQEVTGEEEPS